MPAPRLLSTLATAICATVLSTTAVLLTTPAESNQMLLAQATPSEAVGEKVGQEIRQAIATITTKAFQPPSNPRRRTGHSTTTGTRQGSCVGDTETPFTIFGPSETIGLSASNRPAFAWYLPPSEIAYPVQFRLLAPNEKGIPAPIHTAELDYTSGFSTYQLPAELAALSSGIDYRWQVIVVCDTGYLSRSLNEERTFEVVTPSREVQQSVDAATTSAQRALAYGENGFWYDAIAQVAQPNSAQPNSTQSTAVRQELLADLAELETENQLLKEDLLRLSAISDE